MQSHLILHVDDDQDDRYLVRSTINSIDHSIKLQEAFNGRHALDLLNEAKLAGKFPSLIILDFNMPLMNGFETYKEIKNDPELPFIPVVLFTTCQNLKDSSFWENEGVATFTK